MISVYSNMQCCLLAMPHDKAGITVTTHPARDFLPFINPTYYYIKNHGFH